MFSVASRPARRAGSRVETLRLSLNAPVVALEDLPVGPARAGVAVLRQEGGSRLVVAVRSNRTGQLLSFESEPGLCEEHGDEVALEAAFSFAEKMGFLFDPGEASGEGDAAERQWADFVGEPAPEPREATLPTRDVAAEPVLLSKFRFRAATPSGRPHAPAPPEAPRRSDFWLRLLSRF